MVGEKTARDETQPSRITRPAQLLGPGRQSFIGQGAAGALYLMVGACWLVVVWLQLRLYALAVAALAQDQPLPPAYRRYARWWFWLGWPGFCGVAAIYALMILKPDF